MVLGFLGWMGYVLHLVVAEHIAVANSVQQGKQFSDGGNGFVIHFTFGMIGFIVTLLLLGRFSNDVTMCMCMYVCFLLLLLLFCCWFFVGFFFVWRGSVPCVGRCLTD